MQEEVTALTISLPVSLRREIIKRAKVENRTVSNFVRLVIKQVLEAKAKK